MYSFNEAAAVMPRKIPWFHLSFVYDAGSGFNEAAAVMPRKMLPACRHRTKGGPGCFNEAAAVMPRKIISVSFTAHHGLCLLQ